jgi:hypothetical protein
VDSEECEQNKIRAKAHEIPQISWRQILRRNVMSNGKVKAVNTVEDVEKYRKQLIVKRLEGNRLPKRGMKYGLPGGRNVARPKRRWISSP